MNEVVYGYEMGWEGGNLHFIIHDDFKKSTEKVQQNLKKLWKKTTVLI